MTRWTACWDQKVKHDDALKGAFEGYRNSRERFKEKVRSEATANSSDLIPLEDLQRKAQTVFAAAPASRDLVTVPAAGDLADLESSPLLARSLVGSAGSTLTEMITRLGSSDWVRLGLGYFERNDGVCPFCQQVTPADFDSNLRAYFDDSYELDVQAIANLEVRYAKDSERLLASVESTLAAGISQLDQSPARAAAAVIRTAIAGNLQLIADKRREPSQPVTLVPTAAPLAALVALINEANAQIQADNLLVESLADERRTLTALVWKYLIEVELKVALADYARQRRKLESTIASMTEKDQGIARAIAERRAETRGLEASLTSVQPTIDEINKLLLAVGFHAFSLAMGEGTSEYRLVRANGSDALETLSEGERSFVTFLYFYRLVRGSFSPSGVTTNRVVVIDDPVSSLDSDVAFIVAGLIKELLADILESRGRVLQAFVLTHNVYFHREVTFHPPREKQKAMTEETFWIVRRSESGSIVEQHNKNPVVSSYEMLWREVAKADRSSQVIQNTMRRILEHYLQLLGGWSPDQVCALFEGNDKVICRSLYSWANAGSHFVDDDLYVTTTDRAVETYQRVFRQIFQRTNQLAHYDMMMGGSTADPQLPEVSPVPA